MNDIEKQIDHLLEKPDPLPDLEFVHYAAEKIRIYQMDLPMRTLV